jgi:signal transduction histidine kinase
MRDNYAHGGAVRDQACNISGSPPWSFGLKPVSRRQIAREFNVRLEERTCIARDLHDPLLQSFQGLMLRLQVADELLPTGGRRKAGAR